VIANPTTLSLEDRGVLLCRAAWHNIKTKHLLHHGQDERKEFQWFISTQGALYPIDVSPSFGGLCPYVEKIDAQTHTHAFIMYV